MKKPIIGIIPTFTNDENDPYQDRASFVTMYSEKIKQSGGVPIGILGDVSLYTSICDGYLWPGGNKILFEYYEVLEDAIKNAKPLLGICLGAEGLATMLNVLEDKEKEPNKTFKEIYESNKETNPYLKKIESGNIHLHVVTKEKESIDRARHKIKIIKNSLLYEIVKKEYLDVVSLHEMAINRVSKDILVSAYAEDNVIEAIEYKEMSSLILGVLFHPEIEKENNLFDWLVSSCNKYLCLVNRKKEIKYRNNYKILPYKSLYPKCITDSNLEENTYLAFKELKKFFKDNGYDIDIESAFRTKEIQEEIYKQILEDEGRDYAKEYVAKAGFSEHELGLAIDVCLKKDGEWLHGFDKRMVEFYKLLEKYCADYGFILRYPKDKEKITGYGYEPWHIRYVGARDIAHKIMDSHKTLEEYLERE